MMTSCPKRSLVAGGIKKVASLLAVAFFLAPAAMAQFNIAVGKVYGNSNAVSTATSIASVTNGTGSLTIGFPGTTNLVLNHAINGTIKVENDFDRFAIAANNAVVSNADFAVLMVTGGTNLTIQGGTFRGTTGTDDSVLPPIPGLPAQSNTVSSAAIGGLIANTQHAVISRTRFSGATYQPSAGRSEGTAGLLLYKTDAVLADNGGNSAVLTGGAGGSASLTSGAASSVGGAGLYADSASATVSNGTFRGGNGGSATSSSGATVIGGHALYATNSTIAILKGTFRGGASGTATSTGGGSASAHAGAALYAIDSSIAVSGGSFTGGVANASGAIGGAALHLVNSDLAVSGGIFVSDASTPALLGIADAGRSNALALAGGTFDSIGLSGAGFQSVLAGSNLVVKNSFTVDGGSIAVENLSDAAFQNTFLNNGSMAFSNGFTLASGGRFTLGSAGSSAAFSSLSIASNAVVQVGTGSVSASGVASIASGGALRFSAAAGGAYGSLSADQILFQTNATLSVDASQAGFAAGTNSLTVVSASNGIFVVEAGGATNSATADLFAGNVKIETNVVGRTSLGAILLAGGNDLVFEFRTRSLKEYWNADGQLGELADELDDIQNSAMFATIDQLTPEASQQAVSEAYFTQLNTLQTALLGLNGALGQSLSRGTEFRDKQQLPPGASGPEEAQNDWRAWMKYYGQFYHHDRQNQNSAYDATMHGGVIGMDKDFGALLVGLSGGMGRSRIEADNDAEQDMNAAHGALYATVGQRSAYLDAGLAYGFNQVDAQTGGPFLLEGEYDAHLISGYLGGGLGFQVPRTGVEITPEAGLQYSAYLQEAYTETGDNAVPRTFDEFDADSLRSMLGLNIAALNTTMFDTFGFKAEGRLHWFREFNPDPGSQTFQLEGGANDYQLAYPQLDEDLFRAGFGLTFFNARRHDPKNILLRLDFDELFGDGFYSHNLSAKAIFAF